MLPLTGYVDRWGVKPGETIHFMISSLGDAPYQARLARVFCGDPNPEGPGLRENDIACPINGTHVGREQPVQLGSYAVVPRVEWAGGSIALTLYPTRLSVPGRQCVLHWQSGPNVLRIDIAGGQLVATLNGPNGSTSAVLSRKLIERRWVDIGLTIDFSAATFSLGAKPRSAPYAPPPSVETARSALPAGFCPGAGPLHLAAASNGRDVYNGRLERPVMYGDIIEMGALLAAPQCLLSVVAAWDFSIGIDTSRITDVGPHGWHGELHNLPTRGVTGAVWSGRTHRWVDAPAEYAAIHFHDDDMGDIGWAPSLALTVPQDWPSGLYALHLENEAGRDNIPFVVRAVQAAAQAPVAVLLPTLTYQIYGQYPRGFAGAVRARAAAWGALVETPDEHLEYGLCAYNNHSDGSGVSIASMRRPMIDKRVNQIHRLDPHPGGSGTYWLACDTYLLDWLDRRGIPCEVITDHDVHTEGANLLNRFTVVMTGQHPEYHTEETHSAVAAFIAAGGRFLYLGGNGFYWKVVPFEGSPWAVEVRRAEGGIRTWAVNPGESHHAFDGSLGGMWRRLGKPPQALVGVGFTSQGDYHAEPYCFTTAITNQRVSFMTVGLGAEASPGRRFGERGLMGGGAAGHEIDRADPSLGTPAHALVVAEGLPEDPCFQPVNEERLTHEWPGSRAELIRSDITFFETASGGAVFAVGSMSFIGALPIDGYDNTTARFLENVLRRFADPTPFVWPQSADQ